MHVHVRVRWSSRNSPSVEIGVLQKPCWCAFIYTTPFLEIMGPIILVHFSAFFLDTFINVFSGQQLVLDSRPICFCAFTPPQNTLHSVQLWQSVLGKIVVMSSSYVLYLLYICWKTGLQRVEDSGIENQEVPVSTVWMLQTRLY